MGSPLPPNALLRHRRDAAGIGVARLMGHQRAEAIGPRATGGVEAVAAAIGAAGARAAAGHGDPAVMRQRLDLHELPLGGRARQPNDEPQAVAVSKRAAGPQRKPGAGAEPDSAKPLQGAALRGPVGDPDPAGGAGLERDHVATVGAGHGSGENML